MSSQVSVSLSDIPWSNELFYCRVVTHSPRESATLPSNVSLGSVRAVLPADTCVFAEAAIFTASQVVEQCFALHANLHVASQTIASSHVANIASSHATRF